MSNRLDATSLRQVSPPSLLGDKTIDDAITSLDPQMKSVSHDIREALLLSRIDELPEPVVDLLAWQFHCDFYEPIPLPMDVKRKLVRDSIPWHRKKGTLWAINHLLSTLGYVDVKIIERPEAIKSHVAGGGINLDGSWCVGQDGVALVDPSTAIGMPHISHWALFAVKLNLADAVRPTWKNEVQWAVETAKPLRSCPFYWYWVIFDILVRVRHDHFFFLAKDMTQRYPWCSNKVNGTWRVGTDPEMIALVSRFLDGSWRVGQTVGGGVWRTLRSCNVITSGSLRKFLERPQKHIVFRVEPEEKLGRVRLRLNSGWCLGKHAIFALADASVGKDMDQLAVHEWNLREAWGWSMEYPFNASKLTSQKTIGAGERLECGWKLGIPVRRKALDGVWKVRAPRGIETEHEGDRLTTFTEGSFRSFPVGPKSTRRLNGAWSLKRGVFLGFVPWLGIDGSWRVGAPNWPLETNFRATREADVAASPKIATSSFSAWDIVFPRTPRKISRPIILDGARLDGWRLGTCGAGIGSTLNGVWQIVAGHRGCATESETTLLFSAAVARRPIGRAEVRLGDGWRWRLNGAWPVGASRRLNGAWRVSERDSCYLTVPVLKKNHRHLDGSWSVGRFSRYLDGAWRIGGAPIEAAFEMVVRDGR